MLSAIAVLALALHLARHEVKSWTDKFSINHSLKEFSQTCLKEFPAKTDTQKIISLRHCVFMNTIFTTDKRMGEMWQDRAAMMDWLEDYSSKSRRAPPPMECSYRARTLGRTLRVLGYQAHTIVVTRGADNFNDHVIVEVLNPDTKKWEIQDPSFDVQYVAKKDKSVMSIKDLLTVDFDKMIPCNYEGKCDWLMKTMEDFDVVRNQDYMGSAYIKHDKTLYLGRGFNENKPRKYQGKEMSFCQIHPDWCNKTIRLDAAVK